MKCILHEKLILVLSACVLCVLLASSCKGKNGSEVPVTKMQKGIFQIDLTEEGDLMAIRSVNISSPNVSYRYGMMKITYIADDGSVVHQGDTVIVFDPSEVNKAIVEAQSRLEIDRADLERMLAQHKSELEELEANYKITQLDKEISEIKFENSDYLSEIEIKKIKLNLEKAEIELTKALEQIENRKKIHTEEVQQKKLSIHQSQLRLDDAKETLNKMYVVSPSQGIAIVTQNYRTGDKYKVGEQVYAGYNLIELPDLSKLKAVAKINEVDISKIMLGQKVEIRPDAYSGKVYRGEVKTIANLAMEKERNSKIKVFPVEIIITDSVTDLMPGLTVSCNIILDEKEDVCFLPLETIQKENNQSFVYVKTSSGFKRRDVKLSLSNRDFVIVEEGLRMKDNVALVNPFEEAEEEAKDE